MQVTDYFESNNLFYSAQHGFRKNHSCETALHEVISDCFKNLDNKLTALLLFIDFKKAFDTIDSDLLLCKLMNYGFNNQSMFLIKNYFLNRKQITKIDTVLSDTVSINLGVPQGSIFNLYQRFAVIHRSNYV